MDDKKPWVFTWTDLGDNDITNPVQDALDNDSFQKEGGATFDIAKMYSGKPFAGTSVLEELRELQTVMSNLVYEHPGMTYNELESLLISYGYNLKNIRRTFKKLFGVTPEEFVGETILNNQKIPGSIPRVNFGWGEAKGKNENEWYFIMPWQSGYGLFVQRGDLERELVGEYSTLNLALLELSNKVKKVYHTAKIITSDDILKPDHDKNIFQPIWDPTTDGFGIKLSADSDDNDDEENEKTSDKDKSDDKIDKTLTDSEFFDEKPPSELLDESVIEETPFVEILAEIIKHIDSLRETVMPYVLEITGFKIIANKSTKYEETPNVKTQTIAYPGFSSQIVCSVVFTVTMDNRVKRGLMVFLYTPNGEIITNGTFKGVDGRKYAVSREGFDAYFGR